MTDRRAGEVAALASARAGRAKIALEGAGAGETGDFDGTKPFCQPSKNHPSSSCIITYETKGPQSQMALFSEQTHFRKP